MKPQIDKKKIIACAAAALLFVLLNSAGCRQPTMSDYWPLDKGNSWQYEVHASIGNFATGTLNVVVKSVVVRGKYKNVIVETTSSDGYRIAPSQVEMVSGPDGVYESRHIAAPGSRQGAMETQIQALGESKPYIMKGVPVVGKDWKYEFNLVPMGGNPMMAIQPIRGAGSGKVELKEDVSTPAGKYSAFKISSKTAYGKNGMWRERIYWLADGVGPVKMESGSKVLSRTFVLKRAVINGKKIGKQ